MIIYNHLSLSLLLFWGDSYPLHISPYFGESEIRFVRERAAKSVR